ncbi:MAG: hypothetical protein JWM33_3248 [Caulobacteraceae bacterium]|nr:hypothetical protein [Caulobacteraceae bacterium]
MGFVVSRIVSGLAAACVAMAGFQALSAPARQAAAAPPPTGPQANLGFEIDLGEWKDGYPTQVVASLRAANAEQFVLPAPGYVAPTVHQLSLPPQLPFGTATQVYDDGEGVIIRVTPYPAEGAAPQPAGPIMLDYEITADGVSLRKGRLQIPGGKAGAYTDGYLKVPTKAHPAQTLALVAMAPSTTRISATQTLPGMGAYSDLSVSQNSKGRRDTDDPTGPTTCSFHVPMPSDDYVQLRKDRGLIVVRLKEDRSGYEALGGLTLPAAVAGLPVPTKPVGGWCDEPG